MNMTQVLLREHRAIERVVSSLERASKRLSREEDVYLRFFIGTSVFFNNFVDACHQKNEESKLFPVLIENGMPKESDALEAMLVQHELERRLSKNLRFATERLQAGDIRARKVIIEISNLLSNLIHQHIIKEERLIFPTAEMLIPTALQQQLGEAFQQYGRDAIGDEIGEKYFGLAERLEKESVR